MSPNRLEFQDSELRLEEAESVDLGCVDPEWKCIAVEAEINGAVAGTLLWIPGVFLHELVLNQNSNTKKGTLHGTC